MSKFTFKIHCIGMMVFRFPRGKNGNVAKGPLQVHLVHDWDHWGRLVDDERLPDPKDLLAGRCSVDKNDQPKSLLFQRLNGVDLRRGDHFWFELGGNDTKKITWMDFDQHVINLSSAIDDLEMKPTNRRLHPALLEIPCGSLLPIVDPKMGGGKWLLVSDEQPSGEEIDGVAEAVTIEIPNLTSVSLWKRKAKKGKVQVRHWDQAGAVSLINWDLGLDCSSMPKEDRAPDLRKHFSLFRGFENATTYPDVYLKEAPSGAVVGSGAESSRLCPPSQAYP